MQHKYHIRQEEKEEAESVFVSMTDIMVSFLFIVMLLMAFFASHYSDNQTIHHDPLEIYNAKSENIRHNIIMHLVDAVRADIKKEKIEGLEVSTQGDALRFQGNGLFASGQGGLSGNSLRIIKLLGHHLADFMPCFAVGSKGAVALSCNPDLVMLETVQVEGHTDSNGSHQNNLVLSTTRAISAFNEIVPDSKNNDMPEMLEFQNLLGQPIMAVAGYGEMRPVGNNATVVGRAANRRIDMRFIMYVPPGRDLIPHKVEDIDRISSLLKLQDSKK
ncbi:OmpA/MotB family protein [Zymomonas mobilis]|uniref:OmpA/MotB domain protein n=1 Tax=Zymomonas mobilis subsp. pomaceae (strain ATCC 29192 / DSM 22645 / JCM 10191 / CCUG 17912 / NBRC 13757 / NCIMB 11200 / NRRL B-4491 / Barker I) TaxID=579138 RepID=F8EWF2_ZYMMT|nr:OmpA family protein [Zymomonas mobilis]AEI38595.1 OmpA/MotB domain protein [Zymomonas mobilis subsp. pomaceae ATCC 29192]MDX5949546.1 OmpA family protein [Zymomonas mobilis subsp. pomaceae]GEB89998.1 hypothetical protein ZMO02_16350 [Zymomonas mobilis subsp. pomaceae]